eukprot:6191569-Pleurochrysis_carterae.AAC.1
MKENWILFKSRRRTSLATAASPKHPRYSLSNCRRPRAVRYDQQDRACDRLDWAGSVLLIYDITECDREAGAGAVAERVYEEASGGGR